MADDLDKDFLQKMPENREMAGKQAEMRGIDEEELQEGVEATFLECDPAMNSQRFMNCKLDHEGITRRIKPKIDAINVEINPSIDDEKSIRTTRAAKSFKMRTDSHMGEPKPKEKFNMSSGICRDTEQTSSGRFCTLNVEAE